MRRVRAWAHGFPSESASGSDEAGELKEVAVTASCLREREQQRRPVSQCMGRAAGSQGIEWHRLRPPLEGVVVLGEWRSCSAELAKQRRREREASAGSWGSE